MLKQIKKNKIIFPRTLGEVSFEKLINYMRGENPFFSIKRVFTPHTPRFPKRTTKGDSIPLETLVRKVKKKE